MAPVLTGFGHCRLISMTSLETFGILLRQRQRWVLVALLVVLHVALLAGESPTVSLMGWLVDVGLFLLWQPFIQAERRIGFKALLLILAVLAVAAGLYGWWLLIVWVVVLAALLGGRVMTLAHRPTRIFYLLAFGYLLGALLLSLLPRVVPDPSLAGLVLDRLFAWASPLVFLLMLMMPRPQESRLAHGGTVDFFYSLLIFLLISVLVLGTLAFMLLRRSPYLEAVFMTVLAMACALLLIAWAWTPRPGFSGVGVFLSRYLLAVVLPFEAWLQRLIECAESEVDPDRFLEAAVERLRELPWVIGLAWRPAPGARASEGFRGERSAHAQEFANEPLSLTLYARHELSPALLWHFRLLARLTNEYYTAKARARELQQLSYVRAVHETGARLTHDVKNLLQSLNNLCFVAQGMEAGPEVNRLIQRQLPQIAQRLQQTLERLQAPAEDGAAAPPRKVPARIWWSALEQRYAQDQVSFAAPEFEPEASVPAALFDSVADNLLRNALDKRRNEPGLQIRADLSTDAGVLRVEDDGSALDGDTAGRLFHEPLPSETGFGIGLYHAAQQAARLGYVLRLAANRAGTVCFELARTAAAPVPRTPD